MNEILAAAIEYHREGRLPVPVYFRGKRPTLQDWTRYRPDEEEVNRRFGNGNPLNVGILLGEPSGGLVDIDLDCQEARGLASEFLPATERIFGRFSSPRSHYWYECSPPPKTRQFRDPAANSESNPAAMILEIRSTGAQTVAPPSEHVSAEPIRWSEEGQIGRVPAAEIESTASRLAACALLARHWPAKGARHDTSLALAGFLLRARWTAEEVTHFVALAAKEGGDEEWRVRAKDVDTTIRRLQNGEDATGRPTLVKHLGPKIVTAVEGWLDLEVQSNSTSSRSHTWGDPQPLPKGDVDVPALSPDILPSAFAPWILDIAERTQVPPEFVAIPAIIAAAAVVGRTIGVFPKRLDDWLVIPNLWGAVIARPGLLKSPAQSEALKPLNRLASLAIDLDKEESAEREIKTDEQAELEKILKDGLRKALKSNDETIIEEQREKLRKLKEAQRATNAEEARRYITNDPTTEKLAELMIPNPRGLLLVRDELSGWLLSMSKSGREGDREFYLESWNGYGRYTVDRINRGTLHVPAVCLSVVGGIQPGKILSYVSNSTRGGTGDDGLLQRIQLLVYPNLETEWKNVDRPPDKEARDRVFDIFARLDNLDVESEFGDDLDESGEMFGLRFDDDAQELFDRWRSDLERRLRSGELDSPAFESHLSKYRSLLPSLALIFHLIEVCSGRPAGRIPQECVWRAREWCDLLEIHALRLYAMGKKVDVAASELLAKRIRSGEITDGMTVRSIYRKGWGGLDRSAVEAGLTVLEDSDWCRMVRQQNGRGRAAEILMLNPNLTRTAE